MSNQALAQQHIHVDSQINTACASCLQTNNSTGPESADPAFTLGTVCSDRISFDFNSCLCIDTYHNHQEIEPSGEAATQISNDAWELRSELVYEPDIWTGAFGLQHINREFSALGEEAFVPPVDTTDTGVFWVTERQFARYSFETGFHVGHVKHSPMPGQERDFSTYSVSAGAVIPMSQEVQPGITIDASSRAPVGEKLYSNGAHLVTGSFELGNAALDSERALSVAATFQFQSDAWSATATAYHTGFTDFIYQRTSGEEMQGLPVFVYRQDNATFSGIDTQISREMASWKTGELEIRALIDVVRAKLDAPGNTNLPGIPPLRTGIGGQVTLGSITASLDDVRFAKQDDVADQELITDGYNDPRMYLSYDKSLKRGILNLFLSGKNLTDEEQRSHTSFIKQCAPAPGRTLELGLRYVFQ